MGGIEMYIILGTISYFAIMLVSILTVYSWIDGEKKLAATNFVLIIVFSILTIVCFTKAQEEKVKENLNQREIKMEQFNLEEYLAHPECKVVTRDGRKVRIICTDGRLSQPIVTLVDDGSEDMIITYFENGRFISSNEDDLDLFFAPNKP